MNAEASKDEAKRIAEQHKYNVFLAECKAADLSDVEDLGVVSCHGADLLGRRIVTIALGKHGNLLKKDAQRKKLLMCTIKQMDEIVQSPYVMVYCHSEVNLIPLMLWIRRVYNMLPRKFKKNLKQFFILHPTRWVEALTKVIKTLGVSKKFWQKVQYPQTIAELQKRLQPMPELPQFVHDADRVRVQKLQHASASHGGAKASRAPPLAARKPVGALFRRPLVGMACFSKGNGQMPKVLETLADYLQQLRCSRVEGLFRVPAQEDMLNKYKAVIDGGGIPDFLVDGRPPVNKDVHAAAGLYKFFYRSLPEPLIPVEAFRAMIDTEDRAAMDRVLAQQIAAMPMEHRACLLHLLDFLSLIAFEQGYNKMSKSNLAMVFAPSVLRDHEASPMQEMATIKSKVDILNYLLETYKTNNLFKTEIQIERRSDAAAATAAGADVGAASAEVDVPPAVPPRNRPKALPTGSLKDLTALLSGAGGAGGAVSATSASPASPDVGPVHQVDDEDDIFEDCDI